LSNSLNFAAAHFSGDVFRKVATIHFEELYSEALQDIIKKGPLGLLVILPESNSARRNFGKYKIWEDI